MGGEFEKCTGYLGRPPLILPLPRQMPDTLQGTAKTSQTPEDMQIKL
jgi:hypothetical protein